MFRKLNYHCQLFTKSKERLQWQIFGTVEQGNGIKTTIALISIEQHAFTGIDIKTWLYRYQYVLILYNCCLSWIADTCLCRICVVNMKYELCPFTDVEILGCHNINFMLTKYKEKLNVLKCLQLSWVFF